jgi:hypothetical protein
MSVASSSKKRKVAEEWQWQWKVFEEKWAVEYSFVKFKQKYFV